MGADEHTGHDQFLNKNETLGDGRQTTGDRALGRWVWVIVDRSTRFAVGRYPLSIGGGLDSPPIGRVDRW
jgi:hypothetical protein